MLRSAMTPVTAQAVRQTFGSPSVLSGCFNLDRPSNEGEGRNGYGGRGGGGSSVVADPASIQRVDTEGLESVYTALMNLGPRVVRELWSSIEEVRCVPFLSRIFRIRPPPPRPPLFSVTSCVAFSFLLKKKSVLYRNSREYTKKAGKPVEACKFPCHQSANGKDHNDFSGCERVGLSLNNSPLLAYTVSSVCCHVATGSLLLFTVPV